VRDGFRPVLEGAFVGLASAFFIRMAMQPYFSEATMPSVDPIAIVIGVGPLFIAAAIACYLPARRAAQVDPNEALRDL
jgi:ABC-type antimicrobial peptide transport system permease subunit